MNSVNVALNKDGKFCNKSGNETPFMFDGETSLEASVDYSIVCPDIPHSFIIILLGEMYSIQYVVVYHGEGKQNAF